MRNNLRIGWLGFHQEGVEALRALVADGANVVAVLTLEQDLLAQRSGAADFAALAGELGLPFYRVRNVNAQECVDLLRSCDLDLLFVIGWSQLLHGPALSAVRIGAIGAHASLLPANRGSAPVNWAIIKGETRGGNTLIWLDEAVDAGAIAAQESFPITPYDDCASVYARVAQTNTRMIVEFARRAGEGAWTRDAQPPAVGPDLPRRRPEHGVIDWRWPAKKVYNFVRALTRPYPGAHGAIRERRFVVWKAALLPVRAAEEPGTVLGPVVSPVEEACGIVVATGHGGVVVLLELEDEDGNILRGRTLAEVELPAAHWNLERNELDQDA